MNYTLAMMPIDNAEPTLLNEDMLSSVRFKFKRDEDKKISAKLNTEICLKSTGKKRFLKLIPSSKKEESVVSTQEITQTNDIATPGVKSRSGMEKFKAIIQGKRAAKVPEGVVNTYRENNNIDMALLNKGEVVGIATEEVAQQPIEETVAPIGTTATVTETPIFEPYVQPTALDQESTTVEKVAMNTEQPVQEIEKRVEENPVPTVGTQVQEPTMISEPTPITIDKPVEEIQQVVDKVEEKPVVEIQQPIAEPKKQNAFRLGSEVPSIVPHTESVEDPKTIVETVASYKAAAAAAADEAKKLRAVVSELQAKIGPLEEENMSLKETNASMVRATKVSEQEYNLLKEEHAKSGDEIISLQQTVKNEREKSNNLTDVLAKEREAHALLQRNWNYVVRGVMGSPEQEQQNTYSKAA